MGTTWRFLRHNKTVSRSLVLSIFNTWEKILFPYILVSFLKLNEFTINLFAKKVPLVTFVCPVLTFDRNFVILCFHFGCIVPKENAESDEIFSVISKDFCQTEIYDATFLWGTEKKIPYWIVFFEKTIFFDCNWTWTQNHLVFKGTLNHLAKLACGFTLKHVSDMTRTYSQCFLILWLLRTDCVVHSMDF